MAPSSTIITFTDPPNEATLNNSQCRKSSQTPFTGSRWLTPPIRHIKRRGPLISRIALVTTDEVLSEFLNYFADAGQRKRDIVVGMFEEAMQHSKTVVLPQTRQSLLRGLDLYKARNDKSYSVTDCISMMTMRERNITEVLTHDRHFAQEGFKVLL